MKAALSALKKRQRFGLVYEDHLPEMTILAGLPVKPGAFVQRKDDKTGQTYSVRTIQGTTATVETGDGEVEEIDVNDLFVAKRFGEAIYPALTPLGHLHNGDADRPHHAVINAENYHALQLLLYLYEGKVDCIYLDPPYNTGAKDWKYNNSYVDETDVWRHSKWLSYMEKRLELAKRLLSDDGVLIVTIDEHEVNHLGVLLEQLFPTHLRHLVTIVHNPKGTYKKNFARVEEYAFFCVPNTGEDVIQTMPRGMFAKVANPDQIATASEDDDSEPPFEDLYLRRRGQESSYRRQRPNQFYAILVDEETQEVVGVGPELGEDEEYEITREGSIVTVYPLDTRGEERAWRYYQPTMIDYIEKGQIVVTGKTTRAKQGWVLNHRVPQKTDKRLKTVWWEKRHDAGTHGSDLLTEYLGSSGNFPFPKSVYAVSDCIEAVVRDRPDAIIVDCFAGSGTTFHATCLLNSKDGGSRKSILVSNNEVDSKSAKKLKRSGLRPGDAEYEKHGIYESVTRRRVEAVVSGLRPDGTPVPGEHVWADRRRYSVTR